MKNFLLKILSVFFAVMMMTMQTFAYTINTANAITQSDIQTITQFDDSEIYSAFAGVSALDQYLTVNYGTTYSEISKENSSILNGVSATTSLPLTSPASGDLPLGIPAFLWGCVLGWVGWLIVYFMTDKDKEQTKKAMWGCIVGTAITTVLYVVLIAAEASTSSGYYGY